MYGDSAGSRGLQKSTLTWSRKIDVKGGPLKPCSELRLKSTRIIIIIRIDLIHMTYICNTFNDWLNSYNTIVIKTKTNVLFCGLAQQILAGTLTNEKKRQILTKNTTAMKSNRNLIATWRNSQPAKRKWRPNSLITTNSLRDRFPVWFRTKFPECEYLAFLSLLGV